MVRMEFPGTSSPHLQELLSILPRLRHAAYQRRNGDRTEADRLVASVLETAIRQVDRRRRYVSTKAWLMDILEKRYDA